MLKPIYTIALACLAGLLAISCSRRDDVKVPDYSHLTDDNHPRIIYTDGDFAEIKQMVEEGTNIWVSRFHEAIIEDADSYIGDSDLERIMSGKRLLEVSRRAVKRILYCAYAYKTTGDAKYLAQAEHDIVTVCNFEDWNAIRHFLDAGEMAAAVGLSYDWLYNDLQEESRETARQGIYKFAFAPALYGEPVNHIYEVTNNWNSVCQAGLVCAALAVYEDNPEESQLIIDKALESNVPCMTDSYSPDGNYPEGYGYWNYGTLFEVLLLTAMETVTGSDNGLSAIEGFSKTGQFMIHIEGPAGKCFNFYDGGASISPALPQWYFAWKFGDMSVLYSEQNKEVERNRLLPLFVWYAAKTEITDIPAPSEHIFHGGGMTPIVLVHDTWTMDENDKFLGVKGGRGKDPHAHLDAGTFVFDAEGLRWATDLGSQSYGELEEVLNIWDMRDGSDRWKIFRYNNFNHNTLTVNNTYQSVEGMSKITEVIDSDGKRGAVVDITEPLSAEVASAIRTIYIEGDDLVVEDKVTALGDKAADLRWTLVTPGEPVIEEGAITLTQKGKTRHLTYTSSTGHEAEWQIWSAQSENFWDDPNPGQYECGYTATVNPGETAVITVRLTPTLVK